MPRPMGRPLALAILVVIFILVHHPDLSAQPHPPQGQGGAQKDADVQAAVLPPDSVTVPDGTPLPLKLETGVSSATAKVGDTVEFTTRHSVEIEGLVIVPKGTALSGTVVQVSHPRRLLRNGQVKLAVDKLVLPTGELATLHPRRSGAKKSAIKMKGIKIKGVEGDLNLKWLPLYALLDPLDTAIVLPLIPAAKGEEQVYEEGAEVTVYFRGPLNLDRGALLKLPPP
jgi:hypothetical protein